MEAEKLYKQALAVRTDHLGAEHPDTVATSANLETLNTDKIRLGTRLGRLNTAARAGAASDRARTSDTNHALDFDLTEGGAEAEPEAEYADNLEDHAQPRPDAATNRGAYVTSAGGKRSLASPGKIRPTSNRASPHGRGGTREFSGSFGFDFAPGSVPIGAGEDNQGGHMSTLTRESPLLGKDPMDLGVLPVEEEA